MAIDTSGKWWKGSAASDLQEYLFALSAESYAADAFRLAICTCGANEFGVQWLAAEGAARRICTSCQAVHYICDSAENWQGKPRKFKCVGCRSPNANVGVAYSLYENRLAVRWLFVGARCSGCGILGCVADWKIAYEPSLPLLEQA